MKKIKIGRTIPCEVTGCKDPTNLFEGAFGRGSFVNPKRDRCTKHWKTFQKKDR